MTDVRTELRDRYGDELVFLEGDGFDQAIIGVMSEGPVVYDAQKVIDILVGEGMDRIDAHEHFDFNIAGAYVGEMTPIYVWPLEYEQE